MKLSHLSLAVFSAIALAACGGSGSSSSVGGHNDQDKDKEEVVPTTPTLGKVKIEFSKAYNNANFTSTTASASATGEEFPGYVDEKDYVALSGSAATAAGKVAGKQAFANKNLVDATDNQIKFNGAPNKPDHNGVEFKGVVYKDGDKFKTAYAAEESNGAGKYYFYKQTANGAIDKNAPVLKASELYQTFTADNAELQSISVLDQELAATDKKGADRFAALDHSKIKLGEVVTSDVNAKIKLNSFVNKAPNGGITSFADFATAYSKKAMNSSNVAESESAEATVNLGKLKAYNQPKSFVAVSLDKDGKKINTNGTFFTDATTGTVVLVDPTQVPLNLPENVKASYAGKAFTADTTGDLKLDVTFGAADAYRIDELTITNRGAGQRDLKQKEATKRDTAEFDVALVFADGSAATTNEYDKLKGSFVGSQAEEVAGKLLKTVGNVEVGVFAAQKK